MAAKEKQPTVKQRRAIRAIAENGGNISRGMIEAGYSPQTAKTPQKLTQSKAWQDYVEKHLPDANLAKKHEQLLNASVVERINFSNRDTDEDIQDVIDMMPGYTLLKIIRPKDDKSAYDTYAYVRAPDSNTQDKALDKAYKLKGSYAPEKSLVATLEITNEHKERGKSAVKRFLGD